MGSEWILGRLAAGVNWMRLAKDRDWGRAVVSAVMNLRVLEPRSFKTMMSFGLQRIDVTSVAPTQF
jgi:hypothetical protein